MIPDEENKVVRAIIESFHSKILLLRTKFPRLQKFATEMNTINFPLVAQSKHFRKKLVLSSILSEIPQRDLSSCGRVKINGRVLANLRWVQIYEGLNAKSFVNGMFASRLLGLDGYFLHRKLSIGQMLMLPGVEYPFHTHDVNELYYCISGSLSIRYSFDGNEYFLKPGDLSITPKGKLHSLRVIGSKPVLLYYLWLGNLKTPIWLWEKGENDTWEKVLWERYPGKSWAISKK